MPQWQLVWRPVAVEDRDEIYDFIARSSEQNAALVDARIAKDIEKLRDMPQIGRPGRTPGTRELLIGSTPHIACYRVTENEVLILRVIHGAQLWPPVIQISKPPSHVLPPPALSSPHSPHP